MDTHNTFADGHAGTVVQAGSVGQIHFHQPPRPIREIPRQTPPPPRAFTNQAREFAQLDIAARSAPLIVISGMAGVGKSALACAWLLKRADRYPDGQLYARYGTPDDLAATGDPGEVAAGFLRSLGVAPEYVPQAPAERFGLLRTVLHGRKTAILLDGARDAQHVSTLLPSAPGCLVIATSTRELSALTTVHGVGIKLHPWPQQTARQFLSQLGGAGGWHADEQETEAVVHACAGLPLALALTAATLTARRRTSRPAEPVIDALTQDERLLPALAAGADSITLALDRASGGLSPRAARLYTAAGRLPIPWITSEIAAVLLGSREEAIRAIDELCDHHLITGHDERFNLHDLVRRHAAALSTKDTTMTEDATGQTVTMGQYVCAGLAHAEKILTPSHSGLLGLTHAEALPPKLRPNFSTEAGALAWLEVNRDLICGMAQLCADAGWHALAFEIGHRAWPGILRIGMPRRFMLEIMLGAGRALDDKQMIGMAQTGWPAVWCEEQDYPRALAAADEAEEIYTEFGNKRLRGQAVNARAKTFRAMGEPQQAWGELERALALRKQAGYTRGVGLSLIELGHVALELVQPQVALEHYEEARKVLTVQLPAEGQDPDLYDGTVASIGAARARAELGQIAEAIEELALADESMAARGSVRGRGFAAEALGAVHERTGNPVRATAAYRNALACYENVDAAGTRRVADRLAALGVTP